jgi:hypothetical protein
MGALRRKDGQKKINVRKQSEKQTDGRNYCRPIFMAAMKKKWMCPITNLESW